jgi:hypothetical protein
MTRARALPMVWQIGTGDDSRPYHEWMIAHQIALIGSSWAGRWPNPGYGDEPAIRRFAEDARPGDLVIAKRGTRRALALGVLGPYDFSATLDDVEGWDMGHFRRVRWLSTAQHEFGARVLARDRFCRCASPDVLRWVRRAIGELRLEPPEPRDLAPLPDPGSELDVATLEPELRRVIARARSWHRHTWGAEGFGGIPAECELVSHVTAPLLAALGWPAERIAIGWRHTDVALFSAVRRDAANCRVVVEVKRPGSGLGYARAQAAAYAGRLPGPVDSVVTDGLRYRLHRAGAPDAPPLYANLGCLRESALPFFAALRCP